MGARFRWATMPAMVETPEQPRRRWRRLALRALAVLVALFVVIQVVPYGRSHGNPPVTKALAWDAPATGRLFAGACGDCHSNLTTWPVYSNIAPISWLTQNDVDGGRSSFNVSRWDQPQDVDIGEIVESIRGGDMPPWFYKPLHSGSRLSSTQQQQLIDGLQRTLAASPPVGGGGKAR